jgi:hypothetical protein
LKHFSSFEHHQHVDLFNLALFDVSCTRLATAFLGVKKKLTDVNMKTKDLFSRYEVQMSRVFVVPDLREHFSKYLRRSLNEDSFLFMLAIREFKTSIVTIDKVRVALHILDEFITKESLHEVNIDYKTKLTVIHAFEYTQQRQNFDVLIVPLNVFDAMYSIVYRELREDAFPRYIRSHDFRSFISDRGEQFLRNISVETTPTKPTTTVRPEDFIDHTITDRDISFILRMNEDSNDWISLRATKHNELEREQYSYISRNRWACGEHLSGLHLSKFTGLLPCSAEEALYALCDWDMRSIHDKLTIGADTLDYKKIDADIPYPVAMYYIECKLLFFLRNRATVGMVTTVYDTERQCYSMVGKSSRNFKQYDIKQRSRRSTVMIDGITGFTV